MKHEGLEIFLEDHPWVGFGFGIGFSLASLLGSVYVYSQQGRSAILVVGFILSIPFTLMALYYLWQLDFKKKGSNGFARSSIRAR